MVLYTQNTYYYSPLYYSKIVSKFPIFSTVSYLYSFSTALTTPLNLGGCITVYRYYAETQGYTLCGGFSPLSYIPYMGNKSNLTSYRPYSQDSTFMYIYHLISIDLQLSRLFNSPILHCYRTR